MSYPVKLPADSPVVTLTHPSPHQWVLELHNGVDNRLTERVLREGITPALDIVERDWRQGRKAKDEKAGFGSLIIVGKRGQDKFFSNGFQFEDTLKTPWFIQSYYNPILVRLLEYPIPVVCAMNGHTFAAGFTLAMACDFRVMKASKGWASMNEIHFGAPMPRSLAAVFKAKAPDASTVRKVFLEGHRFTAPEMLAAKLVDEIVDGDTEKVLEAAMALGNKWAPNAKTGVWGLQKSEIYREVVAAAKDRFLQTMPTEDSQLFVDAHRARL